MDQILIMATVIAPVTTAIMQWVKQLNINKNAIPFIAVAVGFLLGIASYPFVDAELIERLWAGGISGLASVGLYELGNKGMREG